MADLTALATLAGALLTVLNAALLIRSRSQIKELHLSLNSRLTQLIAASESLARAEGLAAGVLEERGRMVLPAK
jgi:hypothetical protein